MYQTKTSLLAALQEGKRLEGAPRSRYPGEAVEYAPRKDAANNHPDCYPWQVTGRPDYDRLRASEIDVVG